MEQLRAYLREIAAVGSPEVEAPETTRQASTPADPERHHRRLPEEDEQFRAKVLLAIEYNRRLPKADTYTRRQLCKVFDIAYGKLPYRKSRKLTLKAIETWGRSPTGKRYLEQFRSSADGRLWSSRLKNEGLPKLDADSSNISSDSTSA